jgi:tetratricopeptide (TPR) repeat protein
MIRIEQTIVGLWRLLRADSADGARARRRVTATSAMAIAVLALFVVVGLVTIVLVIAALVLAAVCGLAGALLLHRHRARLRSLGEQFWSRGTEITRRGIRSSRDGSARVASRTVPVFRGVSAHASASARTAHSFVRASAVEARTTAGTLHRRVRSSALADRRGQAVRANALGVQLRRQGDLAAAADQHRRALHVFRDVGDRRAEALTLNNLALALERSGDGQALELFEESATMLGELGDEQNEGQVIANLALAFRRRGQERESDEALETALAKLEPQSNAYRKAERLRRAS